MCIILIWFGHVWNRLEQAGTIQFDIIPQPDSLQCQGLQPAESPEDAASFVSNSSTEDLLPECPTDSVSDVSAASFQIFHRFFGPAWF